MNTSKRAEACAAEALCLPPQCGYKTGRDRLYLRLPQEVVHRIDATSPLASWLEPGGLSADADSEIVVLVSERSSIDCCQVVIYELSV